MALMDEPVWRGTIYSGGWVGASGTGARFGGAANLDAFTDTRWVTVRGDIAPYPF
jgi:benzaldehyde dehydrogenase (NAD)